jgi:hypothetical protein
VEIDKVEVGGVGELATAQPAEPEDKQFAVLEAPVNRLELPNRGLAQRYPSHLQRVLQPAHEMLVGAGVVRSAHFKQIDRDWVVDYAIASRNV